MSDPSKAPPEPQPTGADDYASFWTVVRRQFRKNRAAVAALWCVVGLFALATAAPLLALNVPFVIHRPGEGLEWPLFVKLFDRFVFASGVDIFFNLLLVLLPVWLLTWFLSAAWDRRSEDPRARARLPWLASGLGALGVLYGLILYSEIRSGLGLFRWLVPIAAVGSVVIRAQHVRGRPLHPRRRAAIGTQTRWVLAGLYLATFLSTVFAWEYTSPIEVYRDTLEEIRADGGAAATPWIFYHPSNVAEDGELVKALRLKPPGTANRNYLGTDLNSRDVFTRLLYGTRISLTIGIIAVAIYTTIGCILGGLAGYFGGWVDNLILGILQVMLCIPQIFLLLTIIAVFQTRSIFMIMAAIGLTGWTGITRLIRGEFFRQRSIDYVVAARALGLPARRIIFGHIMKNSMGPVLVAAAFGVAGAILAESFLSFIGLGDQAAPSWGQVLQQGRDLKKNWLILSPGMAIFFVVTVLNLVGDGLRDALDPKLRQ